MKVLQIMTRNSYTVESLYEAIKDKKFTAGQPMYTIHCSYPIITFPAVDKRNQVWITPAAVGACNLFYIQKQEEAGGENILQNAVTNQLTFGIAGLRGKVGQNAQYCEWLVDCTAYELYQLGL